MAETSMVRSSVRSSWSASWASAQEEPSRRSPQDCSYTAARWAQSPIGQVRSLIRIWPAALAITW
ncbi:hypothetical protein ACFV0R_28930 [Streptomyces sp. NPDC059578]|uniref:hypothetical protein n=1 Tax=Streptomyces sp. NPDC059578 TaxID=3346874 RepID=UPI0036A1674A